MTTRTVYACDDCGAEAAPDVEVCGACGGDVHQVASVLVAWADSLHAFAEAMRAREAGDAD